MKDNTNNIRKHLAALCSSIWSCKAPQIINTVKIILVKHFLAEPSVQLLVISATVYLKEPVVVKLVSSVQVHVTSLHVSQSDQPAVHFPCLYHYHNFLTCHCFATCRFYDNAAAEPVTMSGWHDQVSGYSGAGLGNHRCIGIPRNASGPSLLWERQLYFCSVTKMCPSTPRTPSQTTTQGGTFPPSESQEQLHQWQRVERKRIVH